MSQRPREKRIFSVSFLCLTTLNERLLFGAGGTVKAKGLWRNGSAFDSRSKGWAFDSLWAQKKFCSKNSHTILYFPLSLKRPQQQPCITTPINLNDLAGNRYCKYSIRQDGRAVQDAVFRPQSERAWVQILFLSSQPRALT